RAGVVYQFRLDPATRAWQEAGTLQARGLLANEAFGTTVTLEGDVAYIGAPGNGGGYGAAFLFRRDTLTDTWVEQSRLVGFSGGRADRFGTAIAANGRDVWVGAPGSAPTGSAYVYAGATADAFTSADLAKATKSDPRDGFGQAIAMRGNVAAVGATALDFGAGGVFVFERNAAGQWRESAALVSPPDALAAVTGKEVLCNEQGKAGIFDCKNAELLSFLPVPALTLNERGVRLSGIWGWTDARTNREYALVGRNNGTSFVDITDPKKPVFLGDLPMTPGARASSWREIKVYKDHAYIVSDGAGEHGMQVFDLTQLRAVKGAPVKFEPTTLYKRINSAHNIVINEESGFAYSVGGSSGGETCGGGLHMIDVREPKNPKFAGCFADPQTGRASTGYSHDAQCVNYKGPDERYRGREICLGSNETMLSIADVTDKNNPVAITRIGYPNVGYTHQGWLTDDQRYFYVNDELDETSGRVENTRTLVWDLSRLDDPQLIKEFMGNTRASDHNLYVLGNTMYQSNYVAGLRLIDISNPREPVEVGFLDTAPFGENNPGFSGSWSNYPFFKSGTIAVASIGEGLFLVKKRDVKTVF
ncbi:MAG: choice-of-anchor B family protein, partial [Longimicrobiales bacterium]